MPRVDSKTYVYHGGIPNEGEGQGITNVIVAEGVEAIKDWSFFQWLNLKSIYLLFLKDYLSYTILMIDASMQLSHALASCQHELS